MASNTDRSVKCYNEDDIASLIRSLDREEDGHLFAEDVLQTYPYLAESYTKICPQRCDLRTAVEKALSGQYSYDSKLAELRADIQLMVSNCVRFNGSNSPLAATAENFEKFAAQRVEAFIAGKTGGRRVSSLRLQPSEQQPATASNSKQPGGRTPGRSVAHTAQAGAVGGGGGTVPTRKELVQLVNSLVRREDAGAFVVDVTEAYPELKESYEQMCPVKMNLSMMKQRAQEGHYSEDSASSSVADSLAALRADVEVIVGNCATFNQQVDAWVERARSFQLFAHRHIDDFVLKHAPHLRGTLSGVEKFGLSDNSITGSIMAASEPPAKRSRGDEPRKSVQWSETAPPPVLVHIVGDSAPSVEPTPVQPPLDIPAALRRRLVADHISRDSLSLRAVGSQCAMSNLRPPAPPQQPVSSDSDLQSVTKSEDSGSAEDSDDASGGGVEGTTSAAEEAATEDVTLTISADMTVDALLDAFQGSVHKFFQEQRSRPDFTDPFQYSLQEEALYDRVVRILRGEFSRLLPKMLLYESETAQLHTLVATSAVQTIASAANTASAAAETEEEGNWGARLHLCYLVRLVVQFPQIASLCCATAGPSSSSAPASNHARGSSSKQSVLTITKDSLAVMSHVTKVIQELLHFADSYEQQLYR